MSDPGAGKNGVPDEIGRRKAAIRAVLGELAEVAQAAGLAATGRDIREERIPKLDDERLTLVVLGEFNHGKSTFINALLGKPILPAGITPTTAVLSLLRHGPEPRATIVRESGARAPLPVASLGDWVTVDGQNKRAAAPGGTTSESDPVAHLEIELPAPILNGGITIVDTPGVNDINEQRADITYGYVPRADAVLFLLDAGQILAASERRFLEERILRSSRDRLVFVVTKADLLDEPELIEATAFARKHLQGIVPEAPIFPVSAKRALQGKTEEGRLAPLIAHLHVTLGSERRRLVHDHALADATRLAGFLRQSLAMRRRSLELPAGELEERVTRAQSRLAAGRRALSDAAETIRAETAGLRARVRQDLAAFTEEFATGLPEQIEKVAAPDVQRHLGPFIEETWKRWLEAESEMLAAALETLAERVIEVANENAAEVTRQVAEEIDGGRSRLKISVDTFRYDASVFALGALGTTVFLFVNTVAGGLLALAAPIAAVVLRGRVAREIKAEAKQRAPETIRSIAATLGPKLDEIVDGFAARLSDFVAEAGAALSRGIAEVLAGALVERKRREVEPTEADAIGETLEVRLGQIETKIDELRQKVWEAP
jgi:GTPase SAR1 family protein